MGRSQKMERGEPEMKIRVAGKPVETTVEETKTEKVDTKVQESVQKPVKEEKVETKSSTFAEAKAALDKEWTKNDEIK